MTHLVGYRPQIYLQGIPQNIQSHDIQRLDMQQQSLKLPDTELYSIPSHDNQLQGLQLYDMQFQGKQSKDKYKLQRQKCVPMRTRKPIVTTPSPLSTQRPVLTRPRLLADCPCPCHVSRQCRICQPCQESFI
ncbi:hypothetical protein DINM_002002 [Dirofilaria immitis]|nr:hypothetical protein [Dirofilaria immitis]MCP9259020.1 hypothetical protein [Dirofilaria immitis]